MGRQIISLTKKRGVKTINVVRRDEVVNELKNIGCVILDLSWSEVSQLEIWIRQKKILMRC